MIIGLVGRTNVGKSTLFNRLVGTYRAIVTDIAGTTRELLREEVDFGRRHATLTDSPGLEDFKKEQRFIQEIIDEADLLLFIVDGKGDLGEQDYTIRDMIIQANKKKQTILVVNKLDGHVYGKKTPLLLADRYELGFANVLPASAKQEEGMSDVFKGLKTLASTLGIEEKREKPSGARDSDELRLALVGRPNVGKSTLLNTLVGEELARVQDTPGTTLDYIKADFMYKNTPIHLYDTAGIRKKGKIVGLERIAYSKTLKMIEWVKPVVVVLVDIEEGLTHRDKSLLGELIRKGVPLVVAVNKIDLYEPDDADRKLAQIQHSMVGGDWIPLVKISGHEGLGLPDLLDTVIKVHKQYNHRVSTAGLNDVLSKAWMTSPPRFPKNKICKRKYISQVETSPPVFFLSVNNKAYVNFSFKKWIENVIRKTYDFSGVPIQLKFGSKVTTNPYLQKNKQESQRKKSEEGREKNDDE